MNLVFGVLEIVECVEGIVGRCVFIQYMLVLTSCSYHLGLVWCLEC